MGSLMISKEEFLGNIDWIGCSRGHHRAGSDITVGITKYSNGKSPCVSLTFRNGVHEKITKTGYVRIGINGDSLIIAEANQGVGVKISHSNVKENRYAKFTTDIEKFRDFIGDYSLQYEQVFGLYYITKTDKEV